MQQQTQDWIVDVTPEDFPEKVLEASQEKPVLVDFWASWCRPCLMLAPILEKLAREFEGAFILARLNTEEAPELAAQYRIQSIPNVKLFRDGQPVDEFVGVVPEEEIRTFLRRHCPTEADRLAAAGEGKLGENLTEEARRLFQQALDADPDHDGALLGLAKLALNDGEIEEAEELARKISPFSPRVEETEPILSCIQFARLCREFGGSGAVGGHQGQSSGDAESLYRLACCQAANGEYGESLENFLQVVKKDRKLRDDGARKAMLEVFKIVGVRSPLADEYRNRLAKVLF